MSVHSPANIRTMVEEMGHSLETLFRVCRIENDPLVEEPRNHGFLSRAVYHSDSTFCAEPTLPAHSHTRIMDHT
eukprot:12891126-Prorocentrum_lima.AAC.1